MIVYIVSFIGIAICVSILWISYTAHAAEEKESREYYNRFLEQMHHNHALYIVTRKRRIVAKSTADQVKTNDKKKSE